ncbi:hypothetical protein [Mesorhizobium sp. WSM2239]|uniref:Transposase n=2 Tax=unclassified Mesorhizobium TaxID=325217 RepID=A0AAU8DF10_9HYPH
MFEIDAGVDKADAWPHSGKVHVRRPPDKRPGKAGPAGAPGFLLWAIVMIEIRFDRRPCIDQAPTSVGKRKPGRDAEARQAVTDEIDFLVGDDLEAEVFRGCQIISCRHRDEFVGRIHRQWRRRGGAPGLPSRRARKNPIEEIAESGDIPAAQTTQAVATIATTASISTRAASTTTTIIIIIIIIIGMRHRCQRQIVDNRRETGDGDRLAEQKKHGQEDTEEELGHGAISPGSANRLRRSQISKTAKLTAMSATYISKNTTPSAIAARGRFRPDNGSRRPIFRLEEKKVIAAP